MSKVFISFLGKSPYKPEKYDNGKLSETRYVQSAIIEKHGGAFFDKIRILVTKDSYNQNGAKLKEELEKRLAPDVDFQMVHISDDLINDQWKWFETILNLVDFQDEVWFDMTHGYRAFSIVLSAALSFIQKTKNIQLMAVYYGAVDAPGNPIIDMKDFYQINQWADGVSNL
jgi:CRISPR-associated Csx2 family protein